MTPKLITDKGSSMSSVSSNDTRDDSSIITNTTWDYSQGFRKICILATTGLAASKSFVPIEEIFANEFIKSENSKGIFFCYFLALLGSIPTWTFYNRNVSNYYPPRNKEDQQDRISGDLEARSIGGEDSEIINGTTNDQYFIYEKQKTSPLASRIFGFFYAISSTAMVYQYSPYTGTIPVLFAGGTFLTNYAIGYIKTPTGVRMSNSLLDNFKDALHLLSSPPEEYRRYRHQETRIRILKHASKILGNLLIPNDKNAQHGTHTITLKMQTMEGNNTTKKVSIDTIDNVIKELMENDLSDLIETITLYDTHIPSLLIQLTISFLFICMAIAAVNSNFASVLDWTESWTISLDENQGELRLALCYLISALSSIGPLCINLSWSGFGLTDFILKQLGYLSLQAIGTEDLESSKKQGRSLCVTFFIYASALGCNLLQSLQGYFYTEKSLSNRINNTTLIYTLAACSVIFMFATKYEATFNLIQKYTNLCQDRINNCFKNESNRDSASLDEQLLSNVGANNKKVQKVLKYAIEQIAKDTLELYPKSKNELKTCFSKHSLFDLASDVFAVQKMYREGSCYDAGLSANA